MSVCSTCPPMRLRKRAVRSLGVVQGAAARARAAERRGSAPSPCRSRTRARPVGDQTDGLRPSRPRGTGPSPRGPVRTSGVGQAVRAPAAAARPGSPRTQPLRYGPPAGLFAMRVTRPSSTVASSGQPPPQSRLQATGRVVVRSRRSSCARPPVAGLRRGRIPDRRAGAAHAAPARCAPAEPSLTAGAAGV